MTDFEFVFVLYSLVLGLSNVELLGGFGRTLQAKYVNRNSSNSIATVGWLTPLLGLFVLLDLMSFWMAAWVVRGEIHVSSFTLMAIMMFASTYYLAARMVFPPEIDRSTDLDDHYFRVRRLIMSLLLVLLFAQLGFYSFVPALVPKLLAPAPLVLTAILVALMVAAMLAKSKKSNLVILVVLCLRYVVIYLI